MKAFFVAVLALVACDTRWDGQKTYGEVEEKHETQAEAVQLTSAQIETEAASTFQPFTPPKYQDETTLWRLGRARAAAR